MENPYRKELDFAKKVVIDAYVFCATKAELVISDKGSRDLVTNLDYAIENYIVEQIRRVFPGDSILAEENHAAPTHLNQRYWVIDPIDGTVNLSRSLPFYGIQIALVGDKQPVVAAIYLPEFKELLSASKGNGSFLNDQKISVSKITEPKRAITSMGDFSKREGQEVENARRVRALGGLVDDVLKVKMFGAACLDLTYLARGLTDIHIMFSFGLWDVLPGLLIAAEAGAVYQTVSGTEFSTESVDIVLAASNELLKFAVERFKQLKI
jgi:myo-inositol-1(or 4)-monophosphatase